MAASSANRDETVSNGSDSLSLENRSRTMMAKLVHDVTAEAFRLNLYGAPAERVEKANGARLETRGQGENG